MHTRPSHQITSKVIESIHLTEKPENTTTFQRVSGILSKAYTKPPRRKKKEKKSGCLYVSAVCCIASPDSGLIWPYFRLVTPCNH